VVSVRRYKLQTRQQLNLALWHQASCIWNARVFYAGIELNKKLFKRFGCWDVGVQYGGWGKLVMEIRMEDSQK
jgi:hypothetical protein